MAELDSRFALLSEQQRQANLHKNGYMSPDVMHDEVEIIPQELINDLVFHGFPSGAFTSGIPPFFPMGHPLAMPNDSPESARIRTLASTHRPQENSGDATLTWGSEVEMSSGANISPPKSNPRGPTINVQPPTESNARTRLASIPSRTDPRTPVRTENDLVEEIFIPGSGMAEKSLPDTPDDQSHSVRSQAPSPENGRAATTGRALRPREQLEITSRESVTDLPIRILPLLFSSTPLELRRYIPRLLVMGMDLGMVIDQLIRLIIPL